MTLTAVFTPDENGWTMAQLAEWPAVMTCAPTLDEGRETLLDAADRAYGISDDVQTRGIGGLLSDVQTFARRRPGAFLRGTAVVGVMAGRAARNAKADDDGEDELPALPRSTNGARRAGTRGGR